MKLTLLKKKIVWIPLLLVLLGYTFFLYEKYKAYDHVFHIPETDLYIFTKKQFGGKFLVMFANHKDGVRFSPEVDYLEVNTGSYIKLILDKNNKYWIAFSTERADFFLNQIHYNFTNISELDYGERVDMFGEGKNGNLKEQYYIIDIATLEYYLDLFKRGTGQSIVVKLKKETFF